jgi:outer membrane protein insertion porin family
VIDPTDGYIFVVGGDLAGLGGDARFGRLRTRAGWYYPLAEDYVFSIRGDAAVIRGIGEKVVITDRFFPGGDQLRGFRTGGAGARDRATRDSLGSEYYAIATVEQSLPIPGVPTSLGINGRFFGEGGLIGGINRSDPQIQESNTFRASLGFGLTWRSPFGLIRLDFPVPVLKESFDRTENFRVSFGTRF